MVTARMPKGKKEAGVEILTRLGANASQAINSLFDYVIENEALPFDSDNAPDRQSVRERIKLVDSIPLAATNRFATMTDAEIRAERLGRIKYD
jgi:addiction module RelB/DinJ family antitoxin